MDQQSHQKTTKTTMKTTKAKGTWNTRTKTTDYSNNNNNTNNGNNDNDDSSSLLILSVSSSSSSSPSTTELVSRLSTYPILRTARTTYQRIKSSNAYIDASFIYAENSAYYLAERSGLGTLGNALLDRVEEDGEEVVEWGERRLGSPASTALEYTESAIDYLLPLPSSSSLSGKGEERGMETSSSLFRETLVRAMYLLQSIPERWATNHPNSSQLFFKITRIIDYLQFAAERVGLWVVPSSTASRSAAKFVDDTISDLEVVEDESARRIVGFTAAVTHSLYALEELMAAQFSSTTQRVLSYIDPYTPTTIKSLFSFASSVTSSLIYGCNEMQLEESSARLSRNFEELVVQYASLVVPMTPQERKQTLSRLHREGARTISTLLAVVQALVPDSLNHQLHTATWITKLNKAAKEEVSQSGEEEEEEEEGEQAIQPEEMEIFDVSPERRDQKFQSVSKIEEVTFEDLRSEDDPLVFHSVPTLEDSIIEVKADPAEEEEKEEEVAVKSDGGHYEDSEETEESEGLLTESTENGVGEEREVSVPFSNIDSGDNGIEEITTF